MERWLNKIILGDCLDVMREMPDKCVDLALTDPPYGISYDEAAFKNNGSQHGRAAAPKGLYANTSWDRSIPSEDCFKEIFRVSKNQVIFGGEHLCLCLPITSSTLWWVHMTRISKNRPNRFHVSEGREYPTVGAVLGYSIKPKEIIGTWQNYPTCNFSQVITSKTPGF